MVRISICFLLFAGCSTPDDLKLDERHDTFKDNCKGYYVAGTAVHMNVMDDYRKLWTKEWNRYPATLMTKANVKQVVFAEGLNMNGQFRAAVPSFDTDTMYYDPALGKESPAYQRSVIHHEFFHMMDERMGVMRKDPAWAALNPPSFKYGSGGAKMRTNGVGDLNSDIPGFITKYGTSAIEEDKAELYAHLIIDPVFVANEAKSDPVLTKKIALLKSRMAKYHPTFSAKFWPKK